VVTIHYIILLPTTDPNMKLSVLHVFSIDAKDKVKPKGSVKFGATTNDGQKYFLGDKKIIKQSIALLCIVYYSDASFTSYTYLSIYFLLCLHKQITNTVYTDRRSNKNFKCSRAPSCQSVTCKRNFSKWN
jgi:hypothetical protein